MNKTVFICGIDAVKDKNMHQIRGLCPCGYNYVILTTDSTGASSETIGDDACVTLYKSNPRYVVFSMLACLVRVFWVHRPSVVEIYPHSYFSFFAALISRINRVPILIIARGEELKYLQRSMPWWRRKFFRATYTLASGVVYKELYMPKMLDGMGKRLRWHVPNAIQPPDEAHSADREGCTFLYMNSIKPFRHPELCLEAFLRMCTKMGLDNKSNIKLLIVGMSSSVSSPATRRKEEKLRQMIKGCNVPVELHSWTNDPAAFFREANVFLLPSDIVYVNYALLEAMGRGLPVIVQNAEGVEQLVESGLEGYVEEKDVDAWEKAMTKLAESSELRAAMGKAARERIIASFSYERYVERYARIYDYIMGESGKCPPENS